MPFGWGANPNLWTDAPAEYIAKLVTNAFRLGG